MRRDVSNHRQWHRGGEYDYPEGSGYHQRGHARYRGPYDGGGYESDDYDQELRDYNFSRQREREKEQGRQRHDRAGRDRDREDANYSGNERFYPDSQDRWRDDRSSSGSYEDSRDRKEARPREFPDEHDRERGGYSEDEDQASLHSKPSSRDVEQDEKRAKRKEKKKRKPRSPSPEGEAVEEKEALSAGEDAEEKRSVEGKKKKGRDGDAEIAVKGKEGEREWNEPRLQGNGVKTEEELPAKDNNSNKVIAPASPSLPEKGVKRKEKKEKRKKHKRIRGSLGEEEEEREMEEEAARLEEAASRGAADVTLPVNKQRTSTDTDSQGLDNRDIHSAPENSIFDRAELDEKPSRRHSADERVPKEEREFSREAGSRSPRNKPHRDERRRDWENKDGARPKRRRTSNGESPPPPPPPPPPPREGGEAFPPPADMLPRVGPPPPSNGLATQMIRPPYEAAPAPARYDVNRPVPVGASPATLSPIPPAGIPLNPTVVVPPNIGTPPVAVHSPGVAIGVAPAPGLTSPQGVVPPPPPPHPDYNTPPPVPQQSNADTLLDLLRRYPVVWQGLLALKNDSAAVQMHYLAGNGRLAEVSLPQAPSNGIGSVPPPIRIAQRMRLEPSQLEGVIRRMQVRSSEIFASRNSLFLLSKNSPHSRYQNSDFCI